MIKEDYVSFETAKLLKEKGFDEPCLSYFWSEGIDTSYTETPFTQNNMYEGQILRPTLQMAMKWLREKHKIDIAIYPYGEYTCDNYQFDVYKDTRLKISKDNGFMQYEQALEAAINYCLENLI